MTVTTNPLDSAPPPMIEAPAAINFSAGRTAQNASDFRAATAAQPSGSADKQLGTVTLVDDGKCEKPQGFWSRVGHGFIQMVEDAGYADAGMAIPEEPAPKVCTNDSAVKPGAEAAVPPAKGAGDAPLSGTIAVPDSTKPVEGPPAVGNPIITVPDDSKAANQPPPAGQTVIPAPEAGAIKGGPLPGFQLTPWTWPQGAPALRLGPQTGTGKAGGADTDAGSGGKDKPVVRLGDLPPPGQTDLQPPGEKPPVAQPGQEQLNPLLNSLLNNIGTPATKLEPGINPRLGCVLMVSHAMHEADPSFPETNNAAAFRKALAAHGYEAVTVKPGDPALNQSQAGDILVGRRPDGMPSHAAVNMGGGHVFNNNSDAGKGQIDSLDQFNQGMHDKNGHWMKNGFSEVTIYRKKAEVPKAAAPQAAATTGDTVASA
jgi:hypothetical protein